VKTIIRIAATIFTVLLLSHLIVLAFVGYAQMNDQLHPWIQVATAAGAQIDRVSEEAWEFGRPILQLVAILLILNTALERLKIDHVAWTSSLWGKDVRAAIALLVMIAFALASLSGAAAGLDALKDVALVVVGFYFGRSAVTPPIGSAGGDKPA